MRNGRYLQGVDGPIGNGEVMRTINAVSLGGGMHWSMGRNDVCSLDVVTGVFGVPSSGGE